MLSVKYYTLGLQNGPNIPIVTNNANGSHHCLLKVLYLNSCLMTIMQLITIYCAKLKALGGPLKRTPNEFKFGGA